MTKNDNEAAGDYYSPICNLVANAGITVVLDTPTGEVAGALGVSGSCIRSALARHPDRLPGYRVGGEWLIPAEGVALVYPQAGYGDPLTFSHSFPATGTYAVEIGVWNCGLGQVGAVTDTVAVEVVERGGYWAYLPVVMKSD
jgi:hypothetical protein